MQIQLAPGRYVVAVSGGVDSVALLHVLQDMPDVRLTVAHFDHGIRADSSEDAAHVRKLAAGYGLPFVFDRGRLGPDASEAVARAARYRFLHQVRKVSGSTAVITAHHRDDVLETAVLNIVRGTGRRGLGSLKSTDIIKRPLLHASKPEIIAYAHDNRLAWREDSTNVSQEYRRNYIRHRLLTRFEQEDKDKLHGIIADIRATNAEIDGLLDGLLAGHMRGGRLDRRWFVLLPHAVSREVMAAWLRQDGTVEFDSKLLERLVHAAKTFNSGGRVSIGAGAHLIVKRTYLALDGMERYNNSDG